VHEKELAYRRGYMDRMNNKTAQLNFKYESERNAYLQGWHKAEERLQERQKRMLRKQAD
jgi:hypothetical protein